jgi:hypothetical protein
MTRKTYTLLCLASIFITILSAYYWQPRSSALHNRSRSIIAWKAATSIPTLHKSIHAPGSATHNTMSSPRVSRKLAKPPVLAVEQREGVGATVRRSIGGQGLRNWTPFLSAYHYRLLHVYPNTDLLKQCLTISKLEKAQAFPVSSPRLLDDWIMFEVLTVLIMPSCRSSTSRPIHNHSYAKGLLQT